MNRVDMTTNDYDVFLQSKANASPAVGIEKPGKLNDRMFPFQKDIVKWALRRGRAAIFADCGLGKSLMQLEWAHNVAKHTKGQVLILAPLAVAEQTVAEGEKFGIHVRLCNTQEDVGQGLNVTNYEKLHKFDPSAFDGVVLDESSILKSFDGSTKTVLIEAFQKTRFRLACTATPAPNDYMELGNHAEFLGAMTRAEMLAMYFVHDGGDTSQWRIKGHAENAFWDWVCSWGIMLRKPSDLGYEDAGFALPEMVIHKHVVQSTQRPEGMLFMMPAETLQEQRAARRASLNDRVNKVAELVNGSPEPWLVWCELNDEGDQLEKAIQGALQVAGKDNNETKSARLTGFAKGTPRILVSKPSLAGFGLNYQHCANVAFVGLSHSYEQFYQAVRRCWRFGQTRPVHVHIVTSDLELSILDNVLRKEKDSQKMAREMVGHMRDKNIASVRGLTRNVASYCPTEPMQIPSWLTSEDAEKAA